MAAFGSFALLIGLMLAAYNLVVGATALRLIAVGRATAFSPERMAETARRAGIAGFVAVTAAAFALVWSVFHNDFSIEYIVEHSNRALPAPYKFAALWSGQEGSLILWAWLLGAYGFVLRLRHKIDVKLHAYAGTILAAVQVFFLLLLTFATHPFAGVRGGVVPEDGNGLNPLLNEKPHREGFVKGHSFSRANRVNRIGWALPAAEKLVLKVSRGFIPGIKATESMGL